MSMYPPVRRTMVGLLSQPRMSTYLAACGQDVPAAVDLYRWNLDISMALFETTHYLEVGLRNRVDEALTALAGAGQDWLDAPPTVPLNAGTQGVIRTARSHASRAGHVPTHGHVIAELTFGFWPYMFAANYNRTLWRPALKDAFPAATRVQMHDNLTEISAFRNRLAHHEPIFALDLPAKYELVLATAELVDSRLGWWIDATSRVDAVLRARP